MHDCVHIIMVVSIGDRLLFALVNGLFGESKVNEVDKADTLLTLSMAYQAESAAAIRAVRVGARR